jgi:hypothetical protein
MKNKKYKIETDDDKLIHKIESILQSGSYNYSLSTTEEVMDSLETPQNLYEGNHD